MLHEFLSSNREELIRRCRAKVSQRSSPGVTSLELEHGVPVFLGQLVEALRHEQANPAPLGSPGKTPASVESRAGLHGKELLQEGYTVDQVVHDYGDICQAITELAKVRNAPVTVDEFHTLNRLLDNAIADAVVSYGHHRDRSVNALGAEDLHERLGTLADEQRELLDIALKALDALKVGNIGLMGATGTLLEDTLMKLRVLVDKSLPEIRLSSGMTTPPGP
ncbi:MAG: hypothetical protein EPO20_21365 [Betaproteobacteria bacterium]|nr:MAG: hypothetical protein EPO20_21365 [Betaproteobacteria bacterium]